MGVFMNNFLLTILISLGITLVLFLIFREYICWYWKVNETLCVLRDIRDLLKSNSNSNIELTNALNYKKPYSEEKSKEVKSKKVTCPACNSINDSEKLYCNKCDTLL